MKYTNKWIIPALTFIVIGLTVALVYILWLSPQDGNQTSSEGGRTNQSTAQDFTTANGTKLIIDNWPTDGVVVNPLSLTGQVPGSWSHEGLFSIDILCEGDIGLPGATAQLEGDWMTNELVPFTASLSFDSTTKECGDLSIILRKANPSGLPENDDSLSLIVQSIR